MKKKKSLIIYFTSMQMMDEMFMVTKHFGRFRGKE